MKPPPLRPCLLNLCVASIKPPPAALTRPPIALPAGLGPMDGAKSGGRITKSGVKRKVSKFAKKKKQANKMRKK